MEWTARTPLLPHQQEAVAKLLPARVGALFMDMGTGKSRTAIELVRIRQHKIDRVFWFCPVSSKETIRRQIEIHTNCQPESIYVFDGRTNEHRVPQDAIWYIVGVESMSASARVICTAAGLVTERSFIIVDESSYIKGHRALRTQRITRIAKDSRYRLILTGTPLSQGMADLFAQMYFLSQKILGYASWYSFAANHLEYSDKYRGLIVRAHNTEWIAAKIRPYVYQVTKDECLTLPNKIYSSRYCSLTEEQENSYAAAKWRFEEDVMDYANDSQWQSSIPIFRLFTALQGIVCGFDSSEGTITPLRHLRLDLLLQTIAEIPPDEKVVIWGKFHYCIDQIVTSLSERYGDESVAQFHGKLSEHERNCELNRWRKSARFFVATQAAGGHALDLTAASYVIFYANGFKYAERIQAEDRNHRIDQVRKVLYVDLGTYSNIEKRIDQALSKKGNVVDDFRQEVEAVKTSKKDKLRELIRSL